jgi:hypothetical protein
MMLGKKRAIILVFPTKTIGKKSPELTFETQ